MASSRRWGATVPLLAGALAVQYVGLLAELWLLFAQARHPRNGYNQAES